MAAITSPGRSRAGSDLIHLLIVSAIAALLGIYLICTSVLITEDGTFFINRARIFAADPMYVIKAHPPGYPILIFSVHWLAGLFSDGGSLQSWIYSAQATTLLCRLLSLISLYFIGKSLVGPVRSFWGLLILIMLPYPAEFGSDVIREWPHILFLSTGLLLLFSACRSGKWWMFAAAGMTAGLGHIVRPECAQIVIYGLLWLSIRPFLRRSGVGGGKAACLALALVMGFAIPASMYMKARGGVLPTRLQQFIDRCRSSEANGPEESRFGDMDYSICAASAVSGDVLDACGTLAGRLAENLVYVFFPALMVGLYCHFRRWRRILVTERFHICALFFLYVVMMLLLYIKFGYISRRHCMPMVVFTVFYIPVGLEMIARWLSGKNRANGECLRQARRRWFLILMAIGLCVCVGKLTRISPMRGDKRGYIEAANWLRCNTSEGDVIALRDLRIAFYAEREGLTYGRNIPLKAKYVVEILDENQQQPDFGRAVEEKAWMWVGDKEANKRVVIYEFL